MLYVTPYILCRGMKPDSEFLDARVSEVKFVACEVFLAQNCIRVNTSQATKFLQ